MIWFNPEIDLEALKQLSRDNMAGHLGLEWLEIGEDFLKARIPVNEKTRQPYGLLHGGASCVLAETLGSVGAHLVVDAENFLVVGLEINANHIRGVSSGWVTGTARPVHTGKSTQVWDIRINTEDGRLVCISRLTVAILPKK